MTTRKRQDTKKSPTSSAGPHDTAFEDTDEVPSSWTSADNSAVGERENTTNTPLPGPQTSSITLIADISS